MITFNRFVQFLGRAIVPTAGLVLGAVGILGGWKGFLGVLLALGTAVLGAAVIAMIRLICELRALKFFGVEEASSIWLAIGAYSPKGGYDPDLNDYYFEKKYAGSVYPLRGVELSVGLSTAVHGAEAKRAIEELTGVVVNVSGDQQMIDRSTGAVVSLGSPTSNYLSHELLLEVPHSFRPVFGPHSLDWLGETYNPDSLRDYCIIARVHTRERAGLVCAGVDEEGTVAALRYLQNNWRDLPHSRSYDISFVSVYEVEKQNRLVTSPIGAARQSRTSMSWQSG